MTSTIDEAIIEGFICPTCMKSFRTAEVLHVHFETEHKTLSRVVSERSIGEQSPSRKPIQSYAFYDTVAFLSPHGYSRSLTDDFKQLRKHRVNRVALETNNLLIRLEQLINAPPMNKTERREFEQSIVPWIEVKVDLCPSCGKTFGLGLEMAYPLIEETASKDPQTSHRLVSMMYRSKVKLTKVTNAILDYNPIFRRHHHCRLCGHVLCADCSHFLTRAGAVNLIRAVDEHNLGHSINSMKIDNSNENATNATAESIFLTASEHALPLVEIDRGESTVNHLRMCGICRSLMERKLELLDNQFRSSPIAELNTELRKLMNSVNDSMPLYSSIAESLHSGEQRYALEVAKSTRHELLESLQQIDLIRRKLEEMASVNPTGASSQTSSIPANLSTVRLMRAISVMARDFMRTNLPPLRVLPTMHQYDSLTAKRQDELTARWAEEERALAQLENRIAIGTKSRHTPPMGQNLSQVDLGTAPTGAERLAQLAATIDQVSGSLMRARRADNHALANDLSNKLHRLEEEFTTLSSCLQKRQM